MLRNVQDRQQSVPGDRAARLVSRRPDPLHADCGGPKCCELVIESDDPANPVATVFVTGWLHRTLTSALKCWAAEELNELLEAGRHC